MTASPGRLRPQRRSDPVPLRTGARGGSRRCGQVFQAALLRPTSTFPQPLPGREGSRTHAARRAAFSLVELLLVVAILAVLLSILLPALQGARRQAQAAVCGGNLRQLALANLGYAGEHGGRLCPGASNMATTNLHRWHGVRDKANAPFDGARGPLAPYLGADAGIRRCPGFTLFERGAAAFEQSCGGYGYNLAYLGRSLRPKNRTSFSVVSDLTGVLLEQVRVPAQTLAFADTAFAATTAGVIEYSFAEPRFHAEFGYARVDPSLHFRHADKVGVVWLDGHVERRPRTYTWSSGLYPGDADAAHLGWFGTLDDNGYFDLR